MTDSWDEVLDWERWAKEVLTDWRVPFDNHKVGLRLGITQQLCDLRDERDALAARLAGTQDLYVQACEQRDDALALLTKVSLRKSCEGTQPYICHGLATARARLAEALAEMDNHHSDYCDQMRGPIGEQWRDYDKPCTCWVGDVKRTASSAKPDNAPAECLCEKVGTGERLPRCANYPKCICGGPEGWPEVSAPAARTRSQQRRISLMRGEPMPDFDAPPGSAPALNPEQLDRANVELACESVKLQEALAFYAERQHIAFTDEAERARWETGSDPEAPNWMDREGLDMMIEDGGVAREALKPFDSTTVTVTGEQK